MHAGGTDAWRQWANLNAVRMCTASSNAQGRIATFQDAEESQDEVCPTSCCLYDRHGAQCGCEKQWHILGLITTHLSAGDFHEQQKAREKAFHENCADPAI